MLNICKCIILFYFGPSDLGCALRRSLKSIKHYSVNILYQIFAQPNNNFAIKSFSYFNLNYKSASFHPSIHSIYPPHIFERLSQNLPHRTFVPSPLLSSHSIVSFFNELKQSFSRDSFLAPFPTIIFRN